MQCAIDLSSPAGPYLVRVLNSNSENFDPTVNKTMLSAASDKKKLRLTWLVGCLAGAAAMLTWLCGLYPTAIAIIVLTLAFWAYRRWWAPQEAETLVANLRDSMELFRVAFDYAAIGMALVSPTGRWLRVNRSLCGILGYTKEELLATDFQGSVHPDDVGPSVANIHQLL